MAGEHADVEAQELDDQRWQDIASRLKGVTSEDFGKFLESKGFKGECVFCGGKVAIVDLGQPDRLPVSVSSDFPPSLESLVFHYELRTRCANCGNFQSFDRSKVADWKDEQI